MVSEVIFPRFWGVVCIEKCFCAKRDISETALPITISKFRKHFSIQTTPQNLGKITSESTFDHSKVVFRPFYAQKEFLRKIPSLPDFEIRDSDDTQTIILENNIRPSSTFFVSGGYLRTVVT